MKLKGAKTSIHVEITLIKCCLVTSIWKVPFFLVIVCNKLLIRQTIDKQTIDVSWCLTLRSLSKKSVVNA